MAVLFTAILICSLLLPFSPVQAEENKTFVSFYTGVYSDTALHEVVRLKTDFKDSYVYVLSVGRELGRYKDWVGFEIEGQAGVHSGLQSNYEINGVFTMRWLPFPWDKYLDTSFAIGNGVSYASEDPALEIEESDEDETSQWLYYILVELAFNLPSRPQWELFLRAHHRSSVFGAIDGIFTASNFAGAGLRYKF